MRHVSATVDLEASPEQVWEILTDTSGHARWNPFITTMAGTVAVGEKLDIQIVPPGGKTMRFRPTVTDVQPPYRLAWLGHLGVPGLFDGAHSFVLTPMSDGRTRLVQSEMFTGVLVWMARGLLAKTAAGFEAMNDALSKEVANARSTS